ncbi:hypothetical protein DIPPA_18096 [Diplonema papillatum]|nr:hypothetical protein DIPPA_18096 [Diplonema papillatum]KAJ9469903.1 hypothetical protein DIPPA_18096 [Diplonema papillatum]|eukprot:gene17118-26268_t
MEVGDPFSGQVCGFSPDGEYFHFTAADKVSVRCIGGDPVPLTLRGFSCVDVVDDVQWHPHGGGTAHVLLCAVKVRSTVQLFELKTLAEIARVTEGLGGLFSARWLGFGTGVLTTNTAGTRMTLWDTTGDGDWSKRFFSNPKKAKRNASTCEENGHLAVLCREKARDVLCLCSAREDYRLTAPLVVVGTADAEEVVHIAAAEPCVVVLDAPALPFCFCVHACAGGRQLAAVARPGFGSLASWRKTADDAFFLAGTTRGGLVVFETVTWGAVKVFGHNSAKLARLRSADAGGRLDFHEDPPAGAEGAGQTRTPEGGAGRGGAAGRRFAGKSESPEIGAPGIERENERAEGGCNGKSARRAPDLAPQAGRRLAGRRSPHTAAPGFSRERESEREVTTTQSAGGASDLTPQARGTPGGGKKADWGEWGEAKDGCRLAAGRGGPGDVAGGVALFDVSPDGGHAAYVLSDEPSFLWIVSLVTFDVVSLVRQPRGAGIHSIGFHCGGTGSLPGSVHVAYAAACDDLFFWSPAASSYAPLPLRPNRVLWRGKQPKACGEKAFLLLQDTLTSTMCFAIV